VTIIAIEFPWTYPGLLTISSIIFAILGLCSAAPALPIAFHAGVAQLTDAEVFTRDDMS